MALVINTVVGEVSGKMGNKVFRIMHGKNFVSDRPLNYKAAKTPAARKARSSFGMGVNLAKKLITDTALKEVWSAAKIEGTDSYHKIIIQNSKFIKEGKLTDRNKITPDGLFLGVDSAGIQNQVLHLTLNCPDENNLVFPVKLDMLYYFGNAANPLVFTQMTIPESIAGGIYELDIIPGKSMIRLINENPGTLLYIAMISGEAGKKKVYWTSTASVRLS